MPPPQLAQAILSADWRHARDLSRIIKIHFLNLLRKDISNNYISLLYVISLSSVVTLHLLSRLQGKEIK
jgi:hypothetical protein